MTRRSSSRVLGFVCAVAALLATPTSMASWFDVAPPFRGKVTSVVAQVGDVWANDDLLTVYHEELKGRYKDTPELDEFRAKEQWVSVFSSRSARYPGVFNGRSKASDNLGRGDIVKMRIVNYRHISSYYQLSTVEEVLCKAGSADYEACAKANPLSWLDEAGERLEYRPR